MIRLWTEQEYKCKMNINLNCDMINDCDHKMFYCEWRPIVHPKDFSPVSTFLNWEYVSLSELFSLAMKKRQNFGTESNNIVTRQSVWLYWIWHIFSTQAWGSDHQLRNRRVISVAAGLQNMMFQMALFAAWAFCWSCIAPPLSSPSLG